MHAAEIAKINRPAESLAVGDGAVWPADRLPDAGSVLAWKLLVGKLLVGEQLRCGQWLL